MTDVSIYVNGIKQSNRTALTRIVNNVFNAAGYTLCILGQLLVK